MFDDRMNEDQNEDRDDRKWKEVKLPFNLQGREWIDILAITRIDSSIYFTAKYPFVYSLDNFSLECLWQNLKIIPSTLRLHLFLLSFDERSEYIYSRLVNQSLINRKKIISLVTYTRRNFVITNISQNLSYIVEGKLYSGYLIFVLVSESNWINFRRNYSICSVLMSDFN